jgi:hypothetical protein
MKVMPTMLRDYGWKLQIRLVSPSTIAAEKVALEPLPEVAITAKVDGGEEEKAGEAATVEAEATAVAVEAHAKIGESGAMEVVESADGASAQHATAPAKEERAAAPPADAHGAAAAAAEEPARAAAQATAAGTTKTAVATGGASAASVSHPAVPAVSATAVTDEPQLTWVITPPYMISHQVLTRDYYPSVAAAVLAMKQFEVRCSFLLFAFILLFAHIIILLVCLSAFYIVRHRDRTSSQCAHNAVCVARLAARSAKSVALLTHAWVAGVTQQLRVQQQANQQSRAASHIVEPTKPQSALQLYANDTCVRCCLRRFLRRTRLCYRVSALPTPCAAACSSCCHAGAHSLSSHSRRRRVLPAATPLCAMLSALCSCFGSLMEHNNRLRCLFFCVFIFVALQVRLNAGNEGRAPRGH